MSFLKVSGRSSEKVEALPPVITIDGPAASGKGTVSRQVAAALGFGLLDSGRLYRSLALTAADEGIDLEDAEGLAGRARSLAADAEGLARIIASPRLDGDGVAQGASRVATYAAVRRALVGAQRAMRRPPGLVADGRDMGSVIFPDATLKVFLSAEREVRARRRVEQLRKKGIHATISDTLEDLDWRDRQDSDRSVSPLIRPKGAVCIDASRLSPDAVVRRIVGRFRRICFVSNNRGNCQHE